MTPEFDPMDPELERAVSEIRGEAVDPAVVEAAAARVWARLSEQGQTLPGDGAPASHIRGCADFRALIPDYRAGRLAEARAMLLKDHLHECVACRHVFEGRVVAFPAGPARDAARARRAVFPVRWAAAAAIVTAAGLATWVAIEQFGTGAGRAVVQAVNGALYEVSPAGLRPLAAGRDLPDGVEIRTAKDSGAMLRLRDGSLVELRERSDFSTTRAGADITLHLDRGSVIVQAAKRRSGHLYVVTSDCRVAVTGTVFSVDAGTKGSRVSVIQGQVRVAQDNREKLVQPGGQAVSSASLDPVPVRDDVSWSSNRDRLLEGFKAPPAGSPRGSRLLESIPASTVFFASIPNARAYLAEAKTALRQRVAENSELRAGFGGRFPDIEPVLDKLSAASEYLGGEIAIAAFTGADGKLQGPVFVSEARRDGFPEFLKKEGLPLAVESRRGLAVFGTARDAVERFAASMDSGAGGFQASPCYAPVAESRAGGSLLLCADLSRMGPHAPGGARYFLAEQREVNQQMESRATLGFGGQRPGILAWLAAPSPMGALDYISPDATFVGAFAVRSPAAIVDEVLALQQRSPAAAQKALAEARQQAGFDVRGDLAASLGGEFALALDGPVFPVPSWKLVTEIYDPGRFQSTLRKVVEAYNRETVKTGGKPLRVSEETADGRTYYMIAGGDPNPLTEAHYTFAGGYLIAGPTRALLARALQVKASGASIARSARFVSMTPRDHYANFSALMYENLGTTLAPLAGLLGAFASSRPGRRNALPDLSDIKPRLVAAYGEPDRITIASQGNSLGTGLSDFIGGNILGMAGTTTMPFGQLLGTRVH